MTGIPNVFVRQASVVLVSQSAIDPQTIRPEALSGAGIVPGDWVPVSWTPTGGIYAPVVAQTLYQNGFSIQTEGNRCVFQESIAGGFLEAYEVHPLVQRYIAATRLLPYNAVGINWQLEIIVANPYQWVNERLGRVGGKFSEFDVTSVQITKYIEFVLCYLNFRIENGVIVADCNYHFPLAADSPDSMAAMLNNWQWCQGNLAGDLLARL